ncbi:hypothetical protein PFISCL1PPCAC_1546, partial [Pristionchus fissidentatus]
AAAAAAAAVPYAAPTSTQRYAPTAPAAPVSQPPQQRVVPSGYSVPSPPQHQQQDPFRRENSYAQSMPRRAAPPPPTRSTTNLRGSQTSLSAAAVSNLAASALARSNPNLYEQPLDRSPRRPGVAALAAPAAAPAAARSLVSLNPPSEVLYRSGRDVFRHDDEDEETLVETSM